MQTKPLTPTQERLAAYYATRPVFVGTPSAQPLDVTTKTRQAGKRQLVRKAARV